MTIQKAKNENTTDNDDDNNNNYNNNNSNSHVIGNLYTFCIGALRNVYTYSEPTNAPEQSTLYLVLIFSDMFLSFMRQS